MRRIRLIYAHWRIARRYVGPLEALRIALDFAGCC